jgi:chaperonin GroES
MLKPTIHRVLVKPDDVDGMTPGGLYVPEDTRERLQMASTMGTIVAQGDTAWKDYKVEPETKVGDRVGFARYAGTEFEHDEVKYRLLNDEDILVVIRNEGDSE